MLSIGVIVLTNYGTVLLWCRFNKVNGGGLSITCGVIRVALIGNVACCSVIGIRISSIKSTKGNPGVFPRIEYPSDGFSLLRIQPYERNDIDYPSNHIRKFDPKVDVEKDENEMVSGSVLSVKLDFGFSGRCQEEPYLKKAKASEFMIKTSPPSADITDRLLCSSYPLPSWVRAPIRGLRVGSRLSRDTPRGILGGSWISSGRYLGFQMIAGTGSSCISLLLHEGADPPQVQLCSTEPDLPHNQLLPS
ncbi:uncharacterized protein PGTG_10478 [Puccinia graminis f. sp. tritici CRL 75-36-700-3]|uniref:Uncharacterized protein n=1 Tax=Puccinia graminis f. sp. tritici (strain CRL 75-36-700-3 / race SCCL) TaxID=418459 RepID=E3KIH5_PUCGT|nr:uncharacterized protein PGTG_10478 [Puccinia graminis f. sp. tritici CRL 75-36-700-3]EFP84100.2 hypothetical protein PGTG_10478 [Puccinia graminis f. sp. tritici CRL 75-36-700-3]